ncbi:hypothetical protein [Epiphyas postvittana nucleopolyhedrovirus]|uniref:Uncharacterized protein n=1 Tax=Epiphyas postvittana nucleopolyhedrovirus TaxID=70600 RepID=Q91GE6_NPVEP|nr:hypothetical protein [Epiphyas postvittana nucleopolyhedrovirus]AAK85672.1 unknown [Epiphyas postvittana nucleopolyhedrovirus]
MGLFNQFSQYTRLPAAPQISLAVMSYVNVTLCAYGAIVAAYLSTATSFVELQFLEYWVMLSLLINGLINVTLFLRQSKTEAHEIVYELKMLHAMYFSSALVNLAIIDTAQSAASAVLVNNLIHCLALFLLFVELTVLLGHTLGTYANYRYTKACYLVVLLVTAAVTIIILTAENVKSSPLCNDLLMASFLTAAFMVIAVVWAVRKEAAGSVLQRVQLTSLYDPPPSFTNVKMEDMLKNKQMEI